MLVLGIVLADVRCQSTTTPPSKEHSAPFNVGAVFFFYNEFLCRVIAHRRSSASVKGEGLFESRHRTVSEEGKRVKRM